MRRDCQSTRNVFPSLLHKWLIYTNNILIFNEHTPVTKIECDFDGTIFCEKLNSISFIFVLYMWCENY